MIWYYAFGLAAVSALFLSGCATDQPPEQMAKDSCVGVAPATGTMLRHRDDCGKATAGNADTQEVRDQIRSAPGIGRSPVAPGR